MGSKGWSVLFGVVLLAEFLLCAISPYMDWWLPANVSSFGPDVDYLYYILLGISTFFFILVEALFVWAMWRYAYSPDRKAAFVEGNYRLEATWTIVTALILLYSSTSQISTWEKIKYASRMPESELLVMEVKARQWDWNMRYPANIDRFYFERDTPQAEKKEKLFQARNWAEVPESDDVYLPDELHCWKGANVRIYLKTQDVLHSLFLPHMRLKQDALTGKTIPVWFRATDFNAKFDAKTGKSEFTDQEKKWEIACAELCGGGHYRMHGYVYVYETKEEFLQWLKHARDNQSSHQPEDQSPAVALND